MSSVSNTAKSRKPRALIVEDDLAIAELERDYLEAANFEVTIEPNGMIATRDAKSVTDATAFDLYIIDLMLPESNGFTICREIRGRVERPILVVSARDGDLDKIRALGIGADDYITKPFSPGELVARVKAHLERFERLKGGQNTVIAVGDVAIDLDRKTVTVSGRELTLTATEFQIVTLLASSPGRVFSREEIFDHIRGGGTFGEVSTVTVHIRRLREKLETDPSNPIHIATVWGMGYRFNQ